MLHTSELEQFFSKRTVLTRRDQSHLQVESCSPERLDIPPSNGNALPSSGAQQNSKSTCMEPNLSWRRTIVHFSIEMGKNPHCLSSVLFGFYQISRVRSVRVLSRYGKMKVRFWFGSLCRVFGSVRFGSMRVLIHNLPSVHVYNLQNTQCESKKIHPRFSDILSQTVWNF